MTLTDRIRDFLGINILIRQQAQLQSEMVTKRTLAAFELAARERHSELMDLLHKLELLLVIEAPKRKPTVTNGAMYSLEEDQSTKLAEMLANPPKES